MTKTVPCPQCGQSVAWQDEQIWKPFCSERCKLIDLGDWASESHCITGEPTLPPDTDIDYH